MNYRIPAAAFVAVLLAAPASAQVMPDAQLRGVVRDATEAVVVTATVVITSPQLIGGPRTLMVGTDGRWRAAGLSPGTYTVAVSAPGFEPAVRDDVRLFAGATLIVDTRLAIAPVTERTQVNHAGPVLDVTSAAVTFTLSEPMLRGLPTLRAFSSLINLAPGVAGDQAFGGSKLSNGLYVDGIDTTEAAEQGPWLRFNQNWLQDFQIAGLGADAEYGLSTGVAAYGHVRSGTNRYAGLAEAWRIPGAWVANNTKELSQALQRQFASARIDSSWTANGQLGGPVRRDRLWFFAGVEYITSDTAPAGYQGSDNVELDDARAIGKLTWNARPAARLEGFLQGGHRRLRNSNLSAQVPREATGLSEQPQLSGTARVTQSVGPSIFLELLYAGWHSPGRIEPQSPASRSGPPGRFDSLSNSFSVNTQSYSEDQRRRQSVAGSTMWYGTTGRLTHDVRFGVQFEKAREESTFGFPGGRTYIDLGGVPSQVLIQDESVRRGDTARLTLFVQDRLRLGSRVSLLPGLRVDRFRWSTAERRNVLASTPFSPRIGVAWDVRTNHETVIRAHYGRYTDPAFAQPVLLSDYANASVQIVARVVAPDVFQEIWRQDFGGRSVDPNIEHSYVDQFVGGLEHQLGSGLAVLGQYIHREFRSFIQFQNPNVEWIPVERRDPGRDGIAGTGDDGALFTVFSRINTGPVLSVYRNLENAWRQYRGAQFVLRTTGGGPVQLQASYTRSQTRGTMPTSLHVNAGIRFQGATTNPNRLINGDANTAYDPTNEVKILSVWNPPQYGGWVLGGVYRYLTGGAWGRTFFATGLAHGNESIRAEPRDTNRLPAINQLDLHIEKSLRVGNRTLGAFADVFNVWNQGVPDSEWGGDAVNTASGPNLGVPFLWRPPRQVRVGLQFTF